MKPPSYLELGRRRAFGRPVKRPLGPVEPPPDPQSVPDFDLGTWRVRPSLRRMTRADRIVALDQPTLLAVLILAERPAEGINRDELAARIYGGGNAEDHEPKLRRVLGLLRRVFSEDGAVRIANAPGDAYVLEIGDPVPGRGLKAADSHVLRDDPGAVEAWAGRSRSRWLGIGLAVLIVGGLAAGIVHLVDRGHVVLFGTVSHIIPFATEPGLKTNPSFSPDGRQIVYSWQLGDGSGTHLVLRALGGASWRPLTLSDGLDEYPAWSPAGNLIAFERIAPSSCSVFVVAPDSTGERRVGDCDFGAAGPLTWTRDGRAIIYAHRTQAGFARQLVSLNVDAGTLSGVTNPVVGMPGDSQPVLAPNGRRLVFSRSRAIGVADLFLLDLGTVAVERTTRDSRPIGGSAFEAASLAVVFGSPRGGRWALWRSRMNGSGPDLLLAAAYDLRDPAISGDGRTLAFEEWHLTTHMVQQRADGAGVPTEVRGGTNALERQMQLSPDRTQLAFVSNAGGHERLWLAPVGGGAARPIPVGDADYVESPHWSPDGHAVAFASARKGRFDLWIVDVGSGTLTQLSRDGTSRAPSFSHDGRWLYFSSSRDGHRQIWRQAWPDGAHAEALTAEGGLAALESPDGNALYYVRPDRVGLWLRNPSPGGDDTLVLGELSPADWDNWVVLEDSIWFVLRPDIGPPELARYSIANHVVSHLRPLPDLAPESGMTLAPDGNSVIVATIATARADVKLAELD